MSEHLGYCEHRISSRNTCPECAVKLCERIAELEYYNLGLANESCAQQQRIAELEADKTALMERDDKYCNTIAAMRAENEALEEENARLREAGKAAKWLLDDATFHDGRYGQMSSHDWQKRACKLTDELAVLLGVGNE